MADFTDSTPLQTLTEPELTRLSLTSVQDFRVRVARNDLERVRGLDLAAVSEETLLLELGAMSSSLYSVLAVLDEVAEVQP